MRLGAAGKALTVKSTVIAWIAALGIAAPGLAADAALSQRVWLERTVPDDAALAALRAAGVDGVVLPVGEVAVAEKNCRLTLAPLPDLRPLAGWSVSPLVWVSGEGEVAGGAEAFLAEFAPVQRLLEGGGTLVLAARAGWPGLVRFAEEVAEQRRATVEVALPAHALRGAGLGPWPRRLRLVAVALGNAAALGFPAATPADDLAALDEIDAAGVPYRVAVVVAPRSTPACGPAGAPLAALARPGVAEYQPAERGDAFVLLRPLEWGGATLAAGSTVQVETVDAARFHRDLGHVLRSVRPRLEGWDIASLPGREPTLGMSLEALLDYLRGGQPFPTPVVEASWRTPTRLLLAVANPTPHGSAVASTGNYVEVAFSGTQLLEVGLGDFSGTDYGRLEQGAWRRTVARDADAIRLYLTYLPPVSRVAGGAITFFGRPANVTVRWVLRLGDGGETGGAAVPVTVVRTP